jgi:hypothetical protein
LGYYHARLDGSEKSRGQQIKADGGALDMPPLDGLDRLWQAWHEAGMTTGADVLHWSEIEAYGRITGLERDEMILLYRMSRAYIEGLDLTHPLAREPMDVASNAAYS